MVVWGAGDRRNGRDGAEDPHDRQTVTALPPQPICIHEASMSVAAAVPSGEQRTLVMAGAAVGSSVTSGQGCSGSSRCGEALGRHPKWGAGGC